MPSEVGADGEPPRAPEPPAIVEIDGCPVAYRVRGTRGPRVVLVQGVGVHGDGWRPQVDDLARDHQVLTFDNRGMGASRPMGAAPSVERMTRDLRTLLEAVGWVDAHAVGHSLGALVAIHLALEARARVRSLALLCTVAKGRLATRPSWPVVQVGAVSGLPSRRLRRRAFLSLVLSRDALRLGDRDRLAAELEPLFGHDLAVQPPVVGHQLQALRAYDASARLRELEGVPTLVVSAEEDPIAPPRFGRALAEGIPGARSVVVPSAAHGVAIERAAEVNALLREHVAGAEAAGPGTDAPPDARTGAGTGPQTRMQPSGDGA